MIHAHTKTQDNKFVIFFAVATLLVFCAALKAETQIASIQTPATQAPAAPATKAKVVKNAKFEGYDFEQVVTRLENSVDPLQKEMIGSFQSFSNSVDKAVKLLDDGKADQAVTLCSNAIDEVLSQREKVLKPMWDGQDYLGEQISKVRTRLASAVKAGSNAPQKQAKLDKRTETMLDSIAKRISKEADPVRKKRLIAHYRTIRQLAKIKSMQRKLSPDQRKLWRNVLRVLEDTALAHQQVLMGTEVLFSQFEATAEGLKEYSELLRTFDGVKRLTGAASDLDGRGSGLGKLASDMNSLQQRLGDFNGQIEQVLNQQMGELENQVSIIASAGEDGSSAVMSSEIDDELLGRINKVQPVTEAVQ